MSPVIITLIIILIILMLLGLGIQRSITITVLLFVLYLIFKFVIHFFPYIAIIVGIWIVWSIVTQKSRRIKRQQNSPFGNMGGNGFKFYRFDGRGQNSEEFSQFFNEEFLNEFLKRNFAGGNFNFNQAGGQSGNFNGYQQNSYANSGSYFHNIAESYSVLGISESASDEEVKKAYKSLARKYHPDMHASKSENEKKEAEKRFKIINDAYMKIKDRRPNLN